MDKQGIKNLVITGAVAVLVVGLVAMFWAGYRNLLITGKMKQEPVA